MARELALRFEVQPALDNSLYNKGWTLSFGMREVDQEEKGRHQHCKFQNLRVGITTKTFASV